MRKKESEEPPEARLLRRKRRWVPRLSRSASVAGSPIPRGNWPRESSTSFGRAALGPGTRAPGRVGLPLSWRHDEVDEAMLEHSEAHWGLFEQWCESNGRTAFPADANTCFDFLRANWDRGPELYQTWRAIDERHEAYYWHSGANAMFRMKAFPGARRPAQRNHRNPLRGAGGLLAICGDNVARRPFFAHRIPNSASPPTGRGRQNSRAGCFQTTTNRDNPVYLGTRSRPECGKKWVEAST